MRSSTGSRSCAGVFGVTVGQQLHRALQVGKEHGDLLALAFEGGLGGEDFLGQIARGIPQRGCGEAQQVALGVCAVSGVPHCATELGAWEQVRPTLGAAARAGGVPHSMQNLAPRECQRSQRGQRMRAPSGTAVQAAGGSA